MEALGFVINFAQNLFLPVKMVINTSPRKLLFANNLILSIWSILIVCVSSYVCLSFFASSVGDSISWMGLCIVGCALLATCIMGMRGAHLVSLELLITYFWSIVVFVGPLILGTVACFDFYIYIETYIQHHWELSSFSTIRKAFCQEGTWDDECIAPILGGHYFNSTLAWCQFYYQSDNCTQIRNDAVYKAVNFGRLVFSIILILLILLLLIIKIKIIIEM